MFTYLKAGEFQSPMVMSQFNLPKVVTLPFMPLRRVLECIMCFLAFSGNREIDMMQFKHPESSIAVSEKGGSFDGGNGSDEWGLLCSVLLKVRYVMVSMSDQRVSHHFSPGPYGKSR